MKKKIKLKKAGKVLITALIIALGIGIYSGLGDIGSEASTDMLAGVLCIMGWSYLVFVQIIVLAGIWES